MPKQSLALFSPHFIVGIALVSTSCQKSAVAPSQADLNEPLLETEITIDSINGNNKTIYYREKRWHCPTNPLASAWVDRRLYFEISEGKLWLWGFNECHAYGYLGSGPELTGTWQASGPPETRLLPNAPASCIPDEETAAVYKNMPYSLVKNDVTRLDITPKILKTSRFGVYCSAENKMYDLLGWGADTSTANGYQIVSKSCETATARRLRDDKVVNFTSQTHQSMLTSTISFDGKTCRTKYRLAVDTEVNPCITDTVAANDFTRFKQCMDELALDVIR